MPIDHVVSVLTRGAETFDPGGRHAIRGRVDNNLLDKLLTHPYLHAEPPKSTGREAFGQDWVMGILESKGNSSVLDVLATITFFVARSIHQAYEDFVFPRSEVREVVVSGGGAPLGTSGRTDALGSSVTVSMNRSSSDCRTGRTVRMPGSIDPLCLDFTAKKADRTPAVYYKTSSDQTPCCNH